MKNNDVSIIIQARFGSSRLPGKVLKLFNNCEMLLFMYKRLSLCKNVKNIVIATSTNCDDDKINNFCLKHNIKCFRGSESNVLERFYQTSLLLNSEIIIRCTGDCPLIDPYLLDEAIVKFIKNNDNYGVLEYDLNASFPDGFAFEIFKFDLLKDAYKNAESNYDKEHVTPYIVRKYENNENFYSIFDKNICELQNIYLNLDFKNLHLSVDTQSEFELAETIAKNFNNNYTFTCLDVLNFLNENPNLLKKNENENIFFGKGQDLYVEAKKIIPGGTQLLSKRPEMYLPNHWPSYFQKAEGIEITTLDGVKFKDFSNMGIGSCILGYKDKDVNEAVHECVDRGNMSTLNCPNEVELTRLLCEIHPWAEMARYCRCGGEACSIAVRIARASSKKDKVAFCGYHGWHDWYLSANWNNGDDLSSHLLTGLSPIGVPKNLKNTVFPFSYNKIEELEKILNEHDIGTIIMETQRGEEPKDNFLQKIREICNNKNIILIFDEVSAGFRMNTGGLHMKHNVFPDIAIFAKGMSNGYPMGAIIGRKKFMSAAEDTFISSTYWTEDIGFTAAIATIKKHKKLNVGEHIINLGNYYQNKLKKIGEETGINIKVGGMPCFSSFSFDYPYPLSSQLKTLFVQSMLQRKILAKDTIYLCYSHKKEDIDFYLYNIDEVFKEFKILIDNNEVESKLIGPVSHSGFKRLA